MVTGLKYKGMFCFNKENEIDSYESSNIYSENGENATDCHEFE